MIEHLSNINRIFLSMVLACVLLSTPVLMIFNPINNNYQEKNLIQIAVADDEDDNDKDKVTEDEEKAMKEADDNGNNSDSDDNGPIVVTDPESIKQHQAMTGLLNKMIQLLNKTTVEPPPVECNCTEPPKPNGTGGGTDQILITDILFSKTHGIANENYTDFYNPTKVFDNITDKISKSWSNAGNHAGFDIGFKPLTDKQVCFAEIYNYKPKGSPYSLTFASDSGNQTAKGNLNSAINTINTNNCIKNLKGVHLDITADDNTFSTIYELKLYQNQSKPGPGPGPVPGPGGNGNHTTINMPNANATINLSNSTITFSLDELSVIKIPDFNFTNNNGTEFRLGGNN